MNTLLSLQTFASPGLDAVMLFLTNLGSERAYIALLLITYLGVDARLGRRVGVWLLLSFYLNFHLKGFYDTPRPFEIDPELARSEEARATALGAGFPSGHAQASLTFWAYAALWLKRIWFWGVAGLVVALISVSRIYLGVHLPIDVWGGLLVGVAVVALAWGLDRFINRIRLSRAALLVLGLLGPLALHLFLPVPDSELLMGGLAAFLTGPALVPYSAKLSLWRRVVVATLGLVLVFTVLLGSSLLLPEAVKRDALVGFVRYLIIGYTGVVGTPWLAKRLGLVPTTPPTPVTA